MPTMPTMPIVAYLRVSTSRQGRSGLGLEAQRENITRFAAAEGYAVVSEYVEIETGKGADALVLQLLLWEMSESMGNHDSEVVDASSVD